MDVRIGLILISQHFRQIASTMKHPQDQRWNAVSIIDQNIRKTGQGQKAGWWMEKFGALSPDLGMSAKQPGRIVNGLAEGASSIGIVSPDPSRCIQGIPASTGRSLSRLHWRGCSMIASISASTSAAS